MGQGSNTIRMYRLFIIMLIFLITTLQNAVADVPTKFCDRPTLDEWAATYCIEKGMVEEFGYKKQKFICIRFDEGFGLRWSSVILYTKKNDTYTTPELLLRYGAVRHSIKLKQEETSVSFSLGHTLLCLPDVNELRYTTNNHSERNYTQYGPFCSKKEIEKAASLYYLSYSIKSIVYKNIKIHVLLGSKQTNGDFPEIRIFVNSEMDEEETYTERLFFMPIFKKIRIKYENSYGLIFQTNGKPFLKIPWAGFWHDSGNYSKLMMTQQKQPTIYKRR